MYRLQVVPRMFRFAVAPTAVLMLCLTGMQPLFAQENGEASAGLRRIESSSLDELYVKPGVDFSRFDKIAIGNVPVSFSPYWHREHRDILTGRDVERIKDTMARLLTDEFMKEFTKEGGYRLVDADEADAETLLFSPSIVRLNLYAPDTNAPGIRESYVTTAGHATLSLDVYNAASGELLMHVQDYRFANGFGPDIFFRATRASNAREMRLMMSIWADRVHDHITDLGGRSD